MEHDTHLQTVLDRFQIDEQDAPTIMRAAKTASSHVRDARSILRERLDGERCQHLDVVAMGSLGRGEITASSDLDALVVLHRFGEHHQASLDDVQRAVRVLQEELGLEPPGKTGTFGEVVAAPDLIHRVGLEADTNSQQTRRLLTLMESVSLFAPDAHDALIRAIVARYLDEHEHRPNKLPRFLVNDVMRYWRTITIDYQAKTWDLDQKKWSGRYLKLISTRKLLVAGTLAVAMTLPDEDIHEALSDRMRLPSLAQLSLLADETPGGDEAMVTVINTMEMFLASFDDNDFTGVLPNLTDKAAAMANTRFAELVEASRDLHDALIQLMHRSDENRSMKYLML